MGWNCLWRTHGRGLATNIESSQRSGSGPCVRPELTSFEFKSPSSIWKDYPAPCVLWLFLRESSRAVYHREGRHRGDSIEKTGMGELQSTNNRLCKEGRKAQTMSFSELNLLRSQLMFLNRLVTLQQSPCTPGFFMIWILIETHYHRDLSAGLIMLF